MEKLSFETLNTAKISLPQLEILEISEVKRSVVSLRELLTSCRVDCLWKDVEKCRVVSAQEGIEQAVWFKRQLMNNRTRVGERTES